MPLTHAEMKELENQLHELLPQVVEGKIEAIEYGDPADTCGIFSAFRICYMKTAGGMQFRLAQLVLSRGESTINYYPTANVCIEDTMESIQYFHRDTRLSIKRREIRERNNTPVPQLSWFPVKKEVTGINFSSTLTEEDLIKTFGIPEVVTLGMPD